MKGKGTVVSAVLSVMIERRKCPNFSFEYCKSFSGLMGELN